MDTLIPITIRILTILNYLFIIGVLFSKKSPSKTISWLLVLYFMPMIGFLLYLFFGINWRKKRIIHRISESKTLTHENEFTTQKKQLALISTHAEANEKQELINIASTTTRLPIYTNNSIKVFHNTQHILDSMLKDFDSAHHHIHIEFYTIQNDDTGKLLRSTLINAAKRGIRIKIIVDVIGSRRSLKSSFFKSLLTYENVQLAAFRPVWLPIVNLKANYRNHRKIVVIDGDTGYLGGMNIGDEYLGKTKRFQYWRDTVIRINGESVKNIQSIFFQDWYFVKKSRLNRNNFYFPDFSKNTYGNSLTHIVPSSPHSDWDAIAQLYFEAIASAKRTLYITTPYFIPDEALLMALKTAALGGCDVKILVPGSPDHILTFLATNSYFEEVLRSGVNVFIYDPNRFVHSKVITVDNVVASIGSANVDQRSMNINFEITALIYDKKVVAKINEDFFNDLKHSKQLSLKVIRKRNIMIKSAESVARLFSPIL